MYRHNSKTKAFVYSTIHNHSKHLPFTTMTKQVLQLLLFIFFLTVIAGFNTTSSVATTNKQRISAGQLTDADVRFVKAFLQSFSKTTLNDTLLIKYDFNKDACWNMLDKSKDEYIKSIVLASKERIQTTLLTRPGISIFRFRKPGDQLNKIIKWDDSILIDSTKQLYKLLLKKRTECGSSMIILPDGRFILLQTDPHMEAMDLSQQQITAILNNNKN